MCKPGLDQQAKGCIFVAKRIHVNKALEDTTLKSLSNTDLADVQQTLLYFCGLLQRQRVCSKVHVTLWCSSTV